MGPEHEVIIAYCSGPDCLCTRRMHVDPVGEGIVLCDYCGRCYHLRDAAARIRTGSGRITDTASPPAGA
jgi:hypothetical protein